MRFTLTMQGNDGVMIGQWALPENMTTEMKFPHGLLEGDFIFHGFSVALKVSKSDVTLMEENSAKQDDSDASAL